MLGVQGGDLVAVEATEKDRHEQRGHLTISHFVTEIRSDQLLPLARFDPAAVALPFNELIGEHSPGSRVPVIVRVELVLRVDRFVAHQ